MQLYPLYDRKPEVTWMSEMFLALKMPRADEAESAAGTGSVFWSNMMDGYRLHGGVNELSLPCGQEY